MAGYFTKLNGYVYSGEYVASTDIENGTFVTLDTSNEVIVATTGSMEFVCVEKTDIFGLPALRLRCTEEDGTQFIVEQDNEADYVGEYDERHRKAEAGKLVKMRTPVVGDEILLEVNTTMYAAASVGAEYVQDTTGTIVAKA